MQCYVIISPIQSQKGSVKLPICENLGHWDSAIALDVLERCGFTSQQQKICFFGLDCTVVSWRA